MRDTGFGVFFGLVMSMIMIAIILTVYSMSADNELHVIAHSCDAYQKFEDTSKSGKFYECHATLNNTTDSH